MLKIKRPKNQLFEEMLEDGGTEYIADAFSVYTEDNHVLSFVTDKHVVFLTKEEIKGCFNIFTVAQGENWSKEMEETVWADEYSELFAKRTRKELDIKNSPLWFYTLIEAGFDLYVEQFKQSHE